MKKLLLLTILSGLLAISGFSQTAGYWSANSASRSSIVADKATTRQSFPKEVKLFTLNIDPLRQALFAAVNTPQSSRRSVVISLPNAAGGIEKFEMFEASNFEPALQARFPQIRSFSGKGITDKGATLKLSISPQGIQTMVFRTGKDNEFIEPYSQDHTVYAVFTSQRVNGSLPWTCTTPDEQLATNLNQQIGNIGITARSGGNLKTMRLAQSVNAEYSNYFGATSASQVGLVLAAINNTLARCNGVYEKDLALHLNLIAASTNVIYYNPATDPYTTLSAWNNQLQSTLTSVIGEANYDIGHLFGASGGGGNAGCIGCICVDGTKGRGITSPADGIPQGDNFDIDYVVHEIGHQLGANHTFSMSNEGTGVNKEVGSGITIMGYAGITAQDVAPHSIDIFHQASIDQIQANLVNKTCPVTTTITNATPVVAAVSNYTIPGSTPFALTGSATDANASDVLTYCWEQNDNALTTQTGANSVASPTKLTGPNWLSFRPTTSPIRYFPQLATILAGAQVTGPLPGGDAGANIEALSSVARTLNFRLTVRDNAPYRSTAPASVGQTAFTDMAVTVNAASGPFVVTAPNTAVTWVGGSSQTITWDVAATTVPPVSCANVKISLSTDGGQTFPTVLVASTPNDGTEVLTIPNTASTTARIKVEAVGNIFFDISNTNFSILQPAVLVAGATTITAQSCMPGNGVIDPGETVTVNFCIQNNGGTATTNNLTGTLQNTGGVSGASAAQNYGVVPTGGTQVCRSFSFTANGTCGGNITASINLQDGATNLGTITYTFALGVFTPNAPVATTSSAPIIISTGAASPASPYPSNITVSGITNPVSKVTVRLNNFNHTYPSDLDILLVSPTGQKVMLMSFAGGGADVTNANLIFDDAATSSVPDAGPIPSNATTTYKPTDYDGTTSLPPPAPSRPYTTTLSSLNGLNPNGTWSLYVVDYAGEDGGSINGGWTLNITTSTANCCGAAPVVTAPTVTQPTCTTPTGTIVVNATGSGTLEYSIDNGTTYQLSNTFSGLAAGNYNIRVRQQANPANSTTYSANPVVINAVPAAPATPTVMVTQPTCTAPAGSITVTAPSGAGITYSINGTTYQASNIFNNLTPGNYSVTAKNSSGCVSSPLTVTINPAPAAAPAAPTVTVMQPTCSSPSGSITITAPTGAGITYSINGTTYQAGTTFSNVSPGSYNVTAKNSSGCVSAATPVTINAVPADNQPPVIPTNLTVFLNANSQASVTPASVAPLITDNCAVDPNSITVSANSFNCANITGSSTFQPFVATNATGNQNADEEQGMDFRVNAASGIVITQLGAFDHQANGLMGTQPDGNGGMGIRVAIFNKANQMIVPGLDVVITGNGDAFAGNYRYKNIPAVTLPPGDYLVLAKGYNANELMGNVYLGGGPYPQGDDAGGAISFLNTAFYDGSATPGFTYPAQSVNTGTSNIFKGGTFTYALSQSNTVTIKAADYAGNQSQVVANVMVVDTMYVLTTKNITVNLNSSGQATIQPRDVLQSYKNNCGIDVISSTLQVSPSSFSCADVGAATLSSPHQPFIAINSTGNQNADEEQGMDFRVNAASGIVITQLGAFDHQANGLMGTQPDGNGGLGIRVAIFNKANQMIVPGLDVVITGNGDAFAGNYRYKNIPAVTLPPGDYLVLAKGYNANELMGNVYLGGGPYPQGDNAGGAISFLNTAFYDGSATPGFTYPTSSVNTGTSNIFKGGTFTYKTKMAPGTLVTLTATDVYGNQKKATANVVVTDFDNRCNNAPAARVAPVMAAAISTQQTKELVEVEQEKVSVYPNPSRGAFNVLLSGYSVAKVSVEIRDENGKVVAVKAVTLSSKTQTLTVPFDLGNRASGMYWIRAVSATGVQTTKVVVNR